MKKAIGTLLFYLVRFSVQALLRVWTSHPNNSRVTFWRLQLLTSIWVPLSKASVVYLAGEHFQHFNPPPPIVFIGLCSWNFGKCDDLCENGLPRNWNTWSPVVRILSEQLGGADLLEGCVMAWAFRFQKTCIISSVSPCKSRCKLQPFLLPHLCSTIMTANFLKPLKLKPN